RQLAKGPIAGFWRPIAKFQEAEFWTHRLCCVVAKKNPMELAIWVRAMLGRKSPSQLRPGQVGRTGPSEIRPFPPCMPDGRMLLGRFAPRPGFICATVCSF